MSSTPDAKRSDPLDSEVGGVLKSAGFTELQKRELEVILADQGAKIVKEARQEIATRFSWFIGGISAVFVIVAGAAVFIVENIKTTVVQNYGQQAQIRAVATELNNLPGFHKTLSAELEKLRGYGFNVFTYSQVEVIDTTAGDGTRGEKRIDLSKIRNKIPEGARGLLLKVVVSDVKDRTQGATLACADSEGNFAAGPGEKLTHYFRNGFTSYGSYRSGLSGGIVLCPVFQIGGGARAIELRPISEATQTGDQPDKQIHWFASIIGWY